MNTSWFGFDLPPHLIAQQPAERRDEARMLVVDRARGSLQHAQVRDLPGFLSSGDALVLNNTRVVPARLYGHKPTGGRVECLFIEPVAGSDGEWLVMMKCSPRPRPGSAINLPHSVTLQVLENRADGLNRVRVFGPENVLEYLDAAGEPPLPPYIDRPPSEVDSGRYQTIYASEPGAVAAPTAGLHFTEDLFAAVVARGVQRVELTLHVGPGTFRPVKTERVEDHVMDAERYQLSEAAAATLRAVRAAGGKITAVGSTCTRTLETVVNQHGDLVAASGRSDLFIYPPYTFAAVDHLLTNFHLPKSTLLMMVSAFAGLELTREAYQEAIAHSYRFYSYGDCMLIL